MKTTKLVGALVALAIVGLSLGDALTGHGIKGNKNLNPIVVGDGSSSSGSSSSSSSSSSGGSTSSSSGNEDGVSSVCLTDGGTGKTCVNGKEKKCNVTFSDCSTTKGSLTCPPKTMYTNCNETGRNC